jgi:hypothetical protein
MNIFCAGFLSQGQKYKTKQTNKQKKSGATYSTKYSTGRLFAKKTTESFLLESRAPGLLLKF